jgi:hypothetical protein
MVILFAAACAAKSASIVNAGPPPNVAGSYLTEEFLYASTCGQLATRKEPLKVDVQQSIGDSVIRMAWEDRAFEGRVHGDRSFESKPLSHQVGGLRHVSAIKGHFTDTSFYASVDVRILNRFDPRPGSCSYQLRWAGSRQR